MSIQKMCQALKTVSAQDLREVQDFKYLGSKMKIREDDFKQERQWHGKHLIEQAGSGNRQCRVKLKLDLSNFQSSQYFLVGMYTNTLSRETTGRLKHNNNNGNVHLYSTFSINHSLKCFTIKQVYNKIHSVQLYRCKWMDIQLKDILSD